MPILKITQTFQAHLIVLQFISLVYRRVTRTVKGPPIIRLHHIKGNGSPFAFNQAPSHSFFLSLGVGGISGVTGRVTNGLLNHNDCVCIEEVGEIIDCRMSLFFVFFATSKC